MHILYKIYAKLMVNKIKPILSRLISPEQGAFVVGQCISDNVLITQEFMYNLRRAPICRSLIAIKLDRKRVYDRMHWKFLKKALMDFGFHR